MALLIMIRLFLYSNSNDFKSIRLDPIDMYLLRHNSEFTFSLSIECTNCGAQFLMKSFLFILFIKLGQTI